MGFEIVGVLSLTPFCRNKQSVHSVSFPAWSARSRCSAGHTIRVGFRRWQSEQRPSPPPPTNFELKKINIVHSIYRVYKLRICKFSMLARSARSHTDVLALWVCRSGVARIFFSRGARGGGLGFRRGH